MKKFFTLCVLICIVIVSRSQAVLNEVYPQPGNGYHEFFELYNESDTAENLDNYTVVIYYEEGTTSGFYVLDLPTASVAAHGYYVGASQTSFDIQAQLGQTANFSWNSMPAGGSLTKWQKNGSSYTSVAVPANLNDLLVKINGGGGGVFHVFVYKNGIIVNGLIGGISTSVVPAYIKTMPNLPVDMSGSSPDFIINFNTTADNSLEYLTNSVGTNNGYFRSSDGLCGDWLKSDSPGQHTPGATNGASLSLISSNQFSIGAVISAYTFDLSKSLLTYNISSAPAGAFPLTVEIYADLGIASEWDINDSLIDLRTILSASSGNQDIVLSSLNTAVIVVVKSANDCYNKNLPVASYLSVLPVELISFQGNINKSNKVSLEWKVMSNETIDRFEIQRSYDGNEFKTIGIVFASEKKDNEDYMFYETINSFDKAMYRLKMIDKNNKVTYSKILVFQSKAATTSNIKIIGNPVNDKLTFNYSSFTEQVINVKIYDMTGRVIMSNKINSLEGSNTICFPLASNFKTNMYVLEVSNGSDIQTAKFIKQ
ncbi:MAG TPA: T9SS type A sorting domain-containing protein [Chitinophagaceae bacterium]